MSFVKEFREFAIKGNVIDLAIGIIIGAGFAKIVDSLVNDIIMPLAGLVIGEQGFKNSYIPLSDVVTKAKAANPALPLEEARKLGNILAWGNFVTIIIEFLILAVVVFFMVKAINRARRNAPVQEIIKPI